MPKMSASDLSAMLAAERASALGGTNSSTLTNDRATALDYFKGEMPDMVAPKGRSQAISSDVADTIEGMMPSLMEIFAGSEEVVRFEPVSEDDVEAAAQETDYVNHVFMQKNSGFLILYTLIKDALLSKVGIAKLAWEESEKQHRETYYDQSDDVFAVLLAEGKKQGIKIEEHTEKPQPDGSVLHDVVLSYSEPYGCAKVYNVPPEEFLISKQARDLRTTPYAAHEPHVTEGELIDQGWDEDQVKTLPTKPSSHSTEVLARNSVETADSTSDTNNSAGRLVDICEHYIRCDYDGSGRPQVMRVTTGGTGGETTILKKGGKPVIEEIDDITEAFAAGSPIPMPHRFFGKSLADCVIDIMRIKTALVRAMLDNAYMANNQRIEVAENFSTDRTLDDLLANRPGGVIRTKMPGGILPIPNNPLGPQIMPLLQYIDATAEARTGVSKVGMGLQPDALQNQTAQAAGQVFAATQAKMKMVARILAETVVRDVFAALHKLIRKHGSKAETVRLRNKWVTVDPREWKERNDLTINVGLGSGSKAEQILYLGQIAMMQKEAMMSGFVKPENIHYTYVKMLNAMGFKDTDSFFPQPEPNTPPPQPAEAPQVQVAKINAQLKQGELQQKFQLDQQKAQQDAQLQAVQSDREAQTEAAQAQADIAVQSIKTQQEMALNQQEHEFKMAQLAAKSEADQMNARIKAASAVHGIAVQHAGAEQKLQHNEASARQSLDHKQAAGEQKLSLADRQAKQKQKMALMSTKLKARKSGKKTD